ncbi:MAG: IS5 family transposase [Selenomonadaceae bacterium]|nr:IS5 family transposase [Selenomonadaceae bacterium]
MEQNKNFCLRSSLSGRKEQAIGSSRGGKNTKVHVLLNERMQLLKVILTGGQIHDSEPAIELLKSVALKGKKILADKTYSSEQIRFFIAEHGAFACIPDKANFRIKHDFDSELYKQRNIVERFFQRIKNYRHVSTRYDKLALCFFNFVLLASSVIHF